MDEDEIISLGDSGFAGLQGLSNSNYSSIELSKTRWMHVQGHPAPLWKLNLYLAEALLLFHFVILLALVQRGRLKMCSFRIEQP